METVDELEPEGDQQCDAEQNVRVGPGIADYLQVIRQVNARIDDSGDDHDGRQHIEPGIGFLPNQLGCGGRVLDAQGCLIDGVDIGHA